MDMTSKAGKEMRILMDMTTEILVKHMAGSSKYDSNKYGCETWKEYWRKNSNGKNFPKDNKCPCCGQKDITEETFVGGHVETTEKPKRYFICPVAKECNDKYGKGKEVSHSFIVSLSNCVEITNLILDEQAKKTEQKTKKQG